MIKELKEALYKREPRTDSDRTTRGSAFRAIAILRGIRGQDGGQLSLHESCEVAIKQGAAYKRWCEQERPIRCVQIWAQGQLVSTITLDEDPAVENFTFTVTSSSESVMEILNAGEGEENIVILRLRLALVSRFGIDQTTKLPNGQRLRLKVRMTNDGRFQTLVEFSPDKDRVEPVNAVSKRRPRKEVDHLDKESKPVLGFFPTLVWQLRPIQIQIAFACALMLAGIVFVSISPRVMRDPETHRLPILAERREPIPKDSERNVTPAPQTHVAVKPTLPSQKKSEVRRDLRTSVVYATLQPYAGTRGGKQRTSGGEQQTNTSVVVKPGTNVHLELHLPENSKAGVYRVEVLYPADITRYRTQTRSSNGKMLKLVLSSEVFSLGTNKLKVSCEDETYFYYLNVVTAKRGT